MNGIKIGIGLLVCVLMIWVSPANVQAQCANYRDVALLSQPVGTYSFDNVPASTMQTYGVPVIKGHSYTFTVIEYGSGLGTGLDFTLASAWADSNCATTLTTTSASAVDPPLTANNPTGTNGSRVSFIAPSTGTAMFTLLNTDTANTNAIYLAAADTTMISPRWSTWSGFYTSYGLTNTTGSTVSGTLTFINGDGTVAATKTVMIAPNTNVFVDTTGLPIAANKAGMAIFAHSGTAGSILADGFIANFSLTVPVIQPVKFEMVTRTY